MWGRWNPSRSSQEKDKLSGVPAPYFQNHIKETGVPPFCQWPPHRLTRVPSAIVKFSNRVLTSGRWRSVIAAAVIRRQINFHLSNKNYLPSLPLIDGDSSFHFFNLFSHFWCQSFNFLISCYGKREIHSSPPSISRLFSFVYFTSSRQIVL